jgi:hypothetical protein
MRSAESYESFIPFRKKGRLFVPGDHWQSREKLLPGISILLHSEANFFLK